MTELFVEQPLASPGSAKYNPAGFQQNYNYTIIDALELWIHPTLDTRISAPWFGFLGPFVTLGGPTLDSETGWTFFLLFFLKQKDITSNDYVLFSTLRLNKSCLY